MICFRVSVVCVVLTVLSVGAASTRAGVSGQTVGDVVTNMVKFASSGDTARFAPALESLAQSSVPHLFGMIQKCGMLTNYADRLQMNSDRKARLDYHFQERECHFQVDLENDGKAWTVTRISLCR